MLQLHVSKQTSKVSVANGNIPVGEKAQSIVWRVICVEFCCEAVT